jgi:hypothetical protein
MRGRQNRGGEGEVARGREGEESEKRVREKEWIKINSAIMMCTLTDGDSVN